MDKVYKTMWISFFTNVFLSFLKLISGIIGKSGALIADGIHSFSDLLTDLVAMVGRKLSKKPADEKHPFGHGKIEYVTSIFISIVILFLGLSVILSSVKKETVVPSYFVAIVSFITILLKYLLSSYLIRTGKKERNNILLASGYESRADVLSSIVVFVAVLLMQLSSIFPILKYADVVAMILVGLLILKIGFEILKENLSSILEEQVTDETYLNELKKIILKTKEIHHIDYLKVLKYGSYLKIELEVSMDPFLSLLKSHRHIHECESHLKIWDEKIKYVTIHVNPDETFELKKAKKENFEQIKKYCLKIGLNDRISKEEKEKRIEKNLKKHLKDYQLILVQNEVIGILGAYQNENEELLIDQIYIEERYRYCGIGSKVIQNFIEQNNDKKIVLWILKNNKRAISFYQKLNFQVELEEQNQVKMYYQA